MIKTAYISFLEETGGGQDGNGNPLTASKIPTADILCNLAVQVREYKLYIDGQWKAIRYSITVDDCLLPNIDLDTITEVQLKDANGSNLGVYQVQNLEYLKLTRRIKINV